MSPETKDKFREFCLKLYKSGSGHLELTKWGKTLKDSMRTRWTLSIGSDLGPFISVEYHDKDGKVSSETLVYKIDELIEAFLNETVQSAH